jgi:hypothetical protein
MKTNYISEEEWIQALNGGNLKAFNELFDRYGKRLYHFSLGYLKSAADAEEIVQEIFMKIWDNRLELSAQKSLESSFKPGVLPGQPDQKSNRNVTNTITFIR